MMIVLEALAWTVVVDGDGDRDGVYVCMWRGESQKENDLVPTLKCGKCHNEDSVKGVGTKRQETSVLKDGKEV